MEEEEGREEEGETDMITHSMTGYVLVNEPTLGIGLIMGTINCEFGDLGPNRNT